MNLCFMLTRYLHLNGHSWPGPVERSMPSRTEFCPNKHWRTVTPLLGRRLGVENLLNKAVLVLHMYVEDERTSRSGIAFLSQDLRLCERPTTPNILICRSV